MQRGVTTTHYQTRNRRKQNNSPPPTKLTVFAETHVWSTTRRHIYVVNVPVSV